MKVINVVFISVIILLSSCSTKKAKQTDKEFCKVNLEQACKQVKLLDKEAQINNKLPRTVNSKDSIHWTRAEFDWTEGFFPGTLWYCYQFSGDKQFEESARKMEDKYKSHRFYTSFHDLGFVFNCSYGNDYRLTKSDSAKQILIDAANSLITRFDSVVGCIMSWDVDKGWQAKRGWKYPVIIDNMMNLEMLFEVSKITGDDKYKNVAVSHANTTMKNHFRSDYSSFHVIDYDPETGEVRNRNTAQGYSHESAWARGQAWGLYGYTMCYRYTKDDKYLKLAEKIADFILNNKNLPKDGVPYWDFDVPDKATAPRDASAAAVIASALVELSSYTNGKYIKNAKHILESLSSKEYKAELNKNHNFILKHSVGSIPHNNEIDVPLNYADYYYIEALIRLFNYKQ